MKRISFIVIFLLLSFQFLKGQVDASLSEGNQKNMFDYYNTKHKKQKKTGWILLGTGVPAALLGVLITNPFGAPSDQGSFGIGLAAVGISASIVSIPFFISSKSNKKIARRLSENDSLKTQQEKFNYYTLKYRKQRTAGWFLLGGGLTLVTTGFIVRANDGSRSGSGFMIASGIVSTLTSIPFFISSRTNKKTAKVFLDTGNIGFNSFMNFDNRYVSVGLLIDI